MNIKHNKTDRIPVSHPGELLKEEFLDPLGIKPAQLAKALGVTRARISEICSGKRDITAETAILLGRFFDMSSQFWMNLQTDYDLRLARMKRESQEKRKAVLILKQDDKGHYFTVAKNRQTGKVSRRKYDPEAGLNVEKALESVTA